MSEAKVFRVTGEIRKPNWKTPFKKEVIALKPEHAVEQVYMELGSKHRVKRVHITIMNVEKVPTDKIESLLLRKFITGEKEVGR